MESTELVADFVTTAGAMGTETIGANTAPARRRALAPSDNSVDSRYNFLTQKYIFRMENLCIPWIPCEKKIISVRNRIYFTQNPQNPQNYS